MSLEQIISIQYKNGVRYNTLPAFVVNFLDFQGSNCISVPVGDSRRVTYSRTSSKRVILELSSKKDQQSTFLSGEVYFYITSIKSENWIMAIESGQHYLFFEEEDSGKLREILVTEDFIRKLTKLALEYELSY